jgi:hypothetical protein
MVYPTPPPREIPDAYDFPLSGMGRLMPTVLRSGPCRVYFFSHEPSEAPHVHVDRDERSAKFWIDPVAIARNVGFSARELRRIETLVREHRELLLEAWRGYFGA